MAYDPYPESKLRGWHVVVFLGVVVIVADIVSLQMLGTKTDQFQYVKGPAPAPPPQPKVEAPPKTETLALDAYVAKAAAGFIGPGSKLHLMASLRTADGVQVFKVAVALPILTITVDDAGEFQATAHVSVAATEKQARAIALAKERGCRLSLKLSSMSSPSGDRDDPSRLDEVIKFLETAKPAPAPEIAPLPRPVREDR